MLLRVMGKRTFENIGHVERELDIGEFLTPAKAGGYDAHALDDEFLDRITRSGL